MGKQLSLFKRARKRGASARRRGRKVRPDRVGFAPHVPRPVHDRRHPVHVTMRRVRLGPSFRAEIVHAAIVEQFRAVKRNGVRIVHYSIQDNHLHLMVEGIDRADLGRQMKVLFSRVAFAVNRIALRAGKLFVDRHHRHDLATPTEVRRALVYILFNDRKHNPSRALRPALDEASSARWLAVEDWSHEARPPPTDVATTRERATTRADSWLASIGWRLRGGGPLRIDEQPRASRESRTPRRQ